MRSVRIVIQLVCSITGIFCVPFHTKAALWRHELWEKANTFYARGAWDSAAFCYENIILGGASDATIFYNLGNAEYKLGHTGAAILAYRRALLRKPDYKIASENLQLTESRIPGRIQPPEEVFFVRWWQALTAPQQSGIWAIAALLAFVAAIFLLYRKRVSRSRIAPQLLVAAFLLWGLFLALAIVAALRAEGNKEAVVMHPKVMLKTADGHSLFSIPEGTVVTERSVRGGNAEIVLPDGRSGWLAQRDIAPVN